MTTAFRCKFGANQEPLVDQGHVHGLPVSWNPDDDRFYVHKIGTTDGTNVLATFKSWRNAVQFARRKVSALPRVES
jgi:hypothetical protein